MTEHTQHSEPEARPPTRVGTQAREPGFRDYLATLRRRIWAVVTVVVIVVTLATVHAFKATPVYEATARILIEKQTPKVMDFEDVVQSEASDRAYYKTQAELLQSRSVLERALTEPGMQELFADSPQDRTQHSLLGELRRTVSGLLGARPAAPPEPWERVRKSVTVGYGPDTHLVGVGVESADPERAAVIANAVARAFVGYHLGRRKAVSDEAFDFLREQTRQQEQKLVAAQDALQEFREEAKFVSLDAANPGSPLLGRLSRLNEELTDTQLRRTSLEAQLAVAQQFTGSSDEEAGEAAERLLSLPQAREDPTIAAIRTGLVQAEKELIALSDTYGPGHPQMQAAADKVGLLRKKLTWTLAQVAEGLSPQVEMLSHREQELSRQYDQEQQLALASAKDALTYGRLQNEAARQAKLFDVLVERMREVGLTADYARTNVEVVDPAAVPKVAIRPRRLRIVVSAGLLGLLLGVGLAFFFERMDETVRTPEDLEERVGMPVLGFVPAMNSSGGPGSVFAHRGMVTVSDPTSSATEAYRSIRTNLFFSAPAEEAKALVVTSGGAGDGKTTTAANLALVIAQSGKRVLLMDADFRRPMVHKVFGLDKDRKGLSNVLDADTELEEVIQKPLVEGQAIPNLDVVACGRIPDNPAELLGSQRMRQLLDEARGRYDRILIDTPPVLFVTDASILSGISDGVIMVVKSSRNTRAQARRAYEQLVSVRARVLGGVLNAVQVARLGRYYSDYYYGYRGYHGRYYGAQRSAGKRSASKRAKAVPH